MKVLDFNVEGFKEFLKEAFKEFPHHGQKILVVGIAEGGVPVAELVFNFLIDRSENSVDLDFIEIQRPSTHQKKRNPKSKKILKFIFSILPKFVLNQLRILEHKKLSQRRKSDLKREIQFSDLQNISLYDHILIVDDAVDSGATMKTAVEHLGKKAGKATRLHTLSVVVTQSEPVYKPDYFWLSDVLIRFPWSLDGK